MKKKSRYDYRNKYFNLGLLLIGVLLLGYLIYNTIELRKNTRIMAHARLEYQDYTRIRSRLRDGSDILTEAVRRYAATGDVKYRDEYFLEAFDTKNREWGLGLLNQMPDSGPVTEEIKADFQTAMKHSLDLMNLEYTAMRLVASEEELNDPSYPRELKLAKVSPEDLAKNKYDREHIALGILFGEEYAAYKTDIYSALDRSLSGATRLADNRRQAATKRQNYLWISQFVAMSLFVVCFLVMQLWSERIYSRRTAFLRQMLDDIPLLVFLKDSKTKRYMDGKRAFKDYLHRSGFEDPTGKTDYDLLSAEKAHEIELNEAAALSHEEPTVYYEQFPGGHGQIRYFRTTRIGIRDAAGKPCLLSMALDMTEERERQMSSEATEEALMAIQQEPSLSSLSKMLEFIRCRLLHF